MQIYLYGKITSNNYVYGCMLTKNVFLYETGSLKVATELDILKFCLVSIRSKRKKSTPALLRPSNGLRQLDTPQC